MSERARHGEFVMASKSGPETGYHIQEGTLPLPVPNEWEDQSVNALRLNSAEHGVTSLVITRETLPSGMSISAYTEQALFGMAKNLKDFTLKARIPIEWADGPGTALLVRWRIDDVGQQDQIIACRLGHGQTLLIFTVTHLSPMPDELYTAMLAAISGFCPRNLPGTPPTLSLVKG